jgi:large subunit ribosomal protein L32
MGRPAHAGGLAGDPSDERELNMAVPKRKMSRSNTRSRRSQWKMTAPDLSTCPSCKAPSLSHRACAVCGAYDGRTYAEAVKTEHQPR